ncbi:MAG TPA: glycosyltransferase family 4 protein [Anaerolineales bacterium]|nr:glycosyltransferase family 4 protein [Anaerolineales bacterium]
MSKELRSVALLHYSAPPVIGGVESVMLAHARLFLEAGYPITVVAGKGESSAVPPEADTILIPELDSQHPNILDLSRALEQGNIPARFDDMTSHLVERLSPIVGSNDHLIVHNVFTKHFNLPLTAALCRLLDNGRIRTCIAWCHDISWTSPNSRSKVHPGYPWDLLRTLRKDIQYVTVSQERQQDLAGLFGCSPEQIQVIYNGVDPTELLGLSDAGQRLIDRLRLWESDLNLLMPVRVTQAKNIELAMHVVAKLKERGLSPKLIITGPPDPHDRTNMEYFQQLLSLREALRVREQVHFVYESGSEPGEAFVVDMPVVAELFRVSDALFMPSHREGFGMPVLEAGLTGLPVFCSNRVPAAQELGGQEVIPFSPDADPSSVADLILIVMENNPILKMRRRVRQSLTWRSLFNRQILPLLERGVDEP